MKSFTKSEIEFLKENAEKYGVYVCAQKLGRPFGSVLSRLRRDKIPYTYKLSKATSEEIDALAFQEKNRGVDFSFETTSHPKELAYFIGYFWADGTINREKYLVIEIVKNDADTLKNIFNKIGEFTISTRHRQNRQEQTIFFLKDEPFAKFLMEKGKYPGSIFSHKAIIDYIPYQFRIYFLRGLIDGDGCFYWKKDPRSNTTIFQLTIGSRREQDWSGLLEYFNELSLSPKVVQRDFTTKGYSSSILRLTGQGNIKKLADLLYEKNDKLYLLRKYRHLKEGLEFAKAQENQREQKKKKYDVYLYEKKIATITSLKKYAEDNGLCYTNFARLATHPYKKWKGYQLKLENE